MIDHFNSDVLIQIILFLNVVDSSKLSETSKRFYYLVHQLRILWGAQIVGDVSCSVDRAAGLRSIFHSCTRKLVSPPNLAMSFTDAFPPISDRRCASLIDEFLPKNAIFISVGSEAGIQANTGRDKVISDISISLMLGSFLPERTQITPFLLFGETEDDLNESVTWNKLSSQSSACKAVFVYSCGDASQHIENIVSRLQTVYPTAAIVGGICTSCSVSIHNDDNGNRESIKTVTDGIMGIVFAGDVPVRSVVSRGVKSLICPSHEVASPWRVHKSDLVEPHDDNYMFSCRHLKPYHQIKLVRNIDTDKKMKPFDLFSVPTDSLQFVGLKRQAEDGFELHPLNPYSLHTNSIIVFADGPTEEETYEGASFDGFYLDGHACLEDMDRTLTILRETTKNEVIAGAIMISCCARGPDSGQLMPFEMADAAGFNRHFPDVLLSGFYAMGEIGPIALAGNENVFRQGKAAVQGATAVFALFILPAVEMESFRIDDGTDNITAFVQSNLKRTLQVVQSE